MCRLKQTTFLSVLIVLVAGAFLGGCGGGGGSVTPPSVAFSSTQVSITVALSRQVTLTLTGSDSNATVAIASSSTSVATVSPSTCTLTTSSPSCTVSIDGVAAGSASITATSSEYQITPVSVTVAGSYVPSTQFGVVNNCSYTVWMQSENAPTSADAVVQIESKHVHDYNINYPTLVTAFRVWPKTGCNSSGQKCNTGQQIAPCPNDICQPPIDSLWEGTFNYNPADSTQSGASTSFDTSLVSGFTIPFTSTVIKGSDETSAACLDVDASTISLSECPTTEDLSTPASQMTSFGANAFGPYTTYPDGSSTPVTRTLTSVNLQSTYPTTNQVEGCMSPQTVMTYTNANGFGGLNLGANTHVPPYSAPFIDPVVMYACPFTSSQLITPSSILPDIDPTASDGFSKLSTFCNATAGYCDTGGPTGPAANKVCNLGPINSTQYVQYIHSHTTNLYAQTYDDRTGNLSCNSKDTKYVFTLCP